MEAKPASDHARETQAEETDGTAEPASRRMRTEAEGETRKRTRAAPRTYDETARRKQRRRRATNVTYVAGHKRGRVELKHAVEVSQLTVHRIVANAYEWRDAGYQSRGAKKAKQWEGSRIWDPGD